MWHEIIKWRLYRRKINDLKKESAKRCVEYGRRYVIMQKGVQPNYLLPVKFLDGKSGFCGFAPRESIRIKMNGGGMNFVHGGISLQEMVVPEKLICLFFRVYGKEKDRKGLLQ